nr:hypothetical protein GCM10020092_084710 [Actinoplanes digitatis]
MIVAGTMPNRVTLTRSMIGTWLIRANGSGTPVSCPATRSSGPIETTSRTRAAIAAARAARLRHSSTTLTTSITSIGTPKNVLSSVGLTLSARATTPLL